MGVQNFEDDEYPGVCEIFIQIVQFPESYAGGESRDHVRGGSEGAAAVAHPRTSFASPASQSPAVAVDLSSSEDEVHVKRSITASKCLVSPPGTVINTHVHLCVS